MGRHPVGRARRGHAKEASAFLIDGLVAADRRVVPVGDEERAVRSHRHVGRTEPLVALTLENIDDLGLVARPIVGDRIGPHHVGAGVGMDDLIPEYFRQ